MIWLYIVFPAIGGVVGVTQEGRDWVDYVTAFGTVSAAVFAGIAVLVASWLARREAAFNAGAATIALLRRFRDTHESLYANIESDIATLVDKLTSHPELVSRVSVVIRDSNVQDDFAENFDPSGESNMPGSVEALSSLVQLAYARLTYGRPSGLPGTELGRIYEDLRASLPALHVVLAGYLFIAREYYTDHSSLILIKVLVRAANTAKKCQLEADVFDFHGRQVGLKELLDHILVSYILASRYYSRDGERLSYVEVSNILDDALSTLVEMYSNLSPEAVNRRVSRERKHARDLEKKLTIIDADDRLPRDERVIKYIQEGSKELADSFSENLLIRRLRRGHYQHTMTLTNKLMTTLAELTPLREEPT